MNNELLFPSRQRYTLVKYSTRSFMAISFALTGGKYKILIFLRAVNFFFHSFKLHHRKTNTKWPLTIQSGPSHFVISGYQNSGPFKWSNCPPSRSVTCPATPAPTLAAARIRTTTHVRAERASRQWASSEWHFSTFTGRKILLVIDKYSFLKLLVGFSFYNILKPRNQWVLPLSVKHDLSDHKYFQLC